MISLLSLLCMSSISFIIIHCEPIPLTYKYRTLLAADRGKSGNHERDDLNKLKIFINNEFLGEFNPSITINKLYESVALKKGY